MNSVQPKKLELQYELVEDNAELNGQVETKYEAHNKRNDQRWTSTCLRQGSFVRKSYAHDGVEKSDTDVVTTASKISPAAPLNIRNKGK